MNEQTKCALAIRWNIMRPEKGTPSPGNVLQATALNTVPGELHAI